jgi:hypothetical protein
MDIVVIGSASVKNEQTKKPATRVPTQQSGFTEKRRNRTDRRKSVRDGVVVSLSYKNDRRKRPDRRKAKT